MSDPNQPASGAQHGPHSNPDPFGSHPGWAEQPSGYYSGGRAAHQAPSGNTWGPHADAYTGSGVGSSAPWQGAGGDPEGSVRGRGMAITSLVLGIISLVIAPAPILPLIVAIVGCVLGVLAYVRLRSRTDGGRGLGRGLALAGMITSGVGVLVGIVVSIFWAALVTVAGPQISEVVHCLQISDANQQEFCLDRALPDDSGQGVPPDQLDPGDQSQYVPPDDSQQA